jgi:hypothetical protein
VNFLQLRRFDFLGPEQRDESEGRNSVDVLVYGLETLTSTDAVATFPDLHRQLV